MKVSIKEIHWIQQKLFFDVIQTRSVESEGGG